ncbi:hypothetical protein GFX41_04195 [Salmonella enterica]|nr:hypothetical protein [Salmonella enterica]
MNIQRFSDESTRLKSRNDQSELWGVAQDVAQKYTLQRSEPCEKHRLLFRCRTHHQSSSGGHYDTQNSVQWLSSRSSS